MTAPYFLDSTKTARSQTAPTDITGQASLKMKGNELCDQKTQRRFPVVRPIVGWMSWQYSLGQRAGIHIQTARENETNEKPRGHRHDCYFAGLPGYRNRRISAGCRSAISFAEYGSNHPVRTGLN